MRLHPRGREYYKLQITTQPAVVAGWEASFDGGNTWFAGTDAGGGVTQWLVAGPQATLGAAVVQLAASTVPMIRCLENPEVIVERAPKINLSTA